MRKIPQIIKVDIQTKQRCGHSFRISVFLSVTRINTAQMLKYCYRHPHFIVIKF